MIPTIEEILVKLANGDMAIDDADHWIRQHLARAEDTAHLRDLFAGLAMQGMISHPESDPDKPAGIYARGAYVMADAMMEARNK
jgi:hypothetical protein